MLQCKMQVVLVYTLLQLECEIETVVAQGVHELYALYAARMWVTPGAHVESHQHVVAARR